MEVYPFACSHSYPLPLLLTSSVVWWRIAMHVCKPSMILAAHIMHVFAVNSGKGRNSNAEFNLPCRTSEWSWLLWYLLASFTSTKTWTFSATQLPEKLFHYSTNSTPLNSSWQCLIYSILQSLASFPVYVVCTWILSIEDTSTLSRLPQFMPLSWHQGWQNRNRDSRTKSLIFSCSNAYGGRQSRGWPHEGLHWLQSRRTSSHVRHWYHFFSAPRPIHGQARAK